MSEEKKEKPPIDLAKVRKGRQIKHKDGRSLHISGMYLGPDGPVLMVKQHPTQIVAQNVPVSEVDELI